MLRKCLRFFLLFSLSPALFAAPSAERYEVIIVGAGVAGLAAANELQQHQHKILVLEARDRIGGRIQTINPWGTALDLGASWVHGIEDNPVYDLLSKAGVKTIPTHYNSDNYAAKLKHTAFYDEQGQAISQAQIEALLPLVKQFESSTNQAKDSSQSYADALQAFIQRQQLQGLTAAIFKQLIVLSYEFEFAANLSQLSLQTEASYKDSEVSGEEVILPQGYMQLIGLLAKELPIALGQVVKTIQYDASGVRVLTQDKQYYAKKLILTLPAGVLAAKSVLFKPELPADKLRAIEQAKMGTYDKAYLYFDRVFWEKDKDKEWLNLIPNADSSLPVLDIMNYYRFSEQPILLVFMAGQSAVQFEQLPDAAVVEKIMQQLQRIYGQDIPKPSSYYLTHWKQDPYALGSYSYLAVGSPVDYHQGLAAPVADQLFFAGEASSTTDSATVHGAYASGIRAAREAMQALPKRNSAANKAAPFPDRP